MEYEAVIGLEVHVQLKTKSKMFCATPNSFGDPANTNVSPTCLGLPGALPTPNKQAIILTIQTGLMLGCDIAKICKFDRKNYFYPDMPKNYQISQYDMPLCEHGGVTLEKFSYPKDCQKEEFASARKKIRLVRIHLEEDVAKSFHHDDHSRIDFNRAGTPLMEIVSEADIRSAEEAFAYLTSLKQILIYGNVSDADMEKGQLRCDVNVSIRPKGQEAFGTKCELKNLNSISGVRRSLHAEIKRQIEVVSKGGTIVQETRGWDDDLGKTYSMRTKEDAHDYRYFPDPDLLPIQVTEELLQSAKALVPELPQKKKERLVKECGLSDYQAEVLASDQALGNYYEQASQSAKNKIAVANYIINDFLATEPDTSDLKIPAVYFGEIAELVDSGKINSKQAKKVLSEMFETLEAPQEIVKKLGLTQITDTSALETLCEEAIASNPRSVEDFKNGKKAAINALKGFVMKKTKGQANPMLVDEILQKKL